MKLPSNRDALRIRILMSLIGLLLLGVSVAGALRWMALGSVGQLILGISIFIFVIVGWPLSSWLRKHVEG